jgi:hypothetical protein
MKSITDFSTIPKSGNLKPLNFQNDDSKSIEQSFKNINCHIDKFGKSMSAQLWLERRSAMNNYKAEIISLRTATNVYIGEHNHNLDIPRVKEEIADRRALRNQKRDEVNVTGCKVQDS